MKLGLPILLALLPVVLAAPSPSRTAPRDVPADSDEAVSGIIDLSELADLPAPTPVPVDVAYSSVNLASVATSLSAVQSVTAASSVPTAIPVRKRQASCQPFSSFSSPNNGVPTDVSGFQSHFASTPANLVGYGAPIYTGVNSVGPKNGLMGVYAYTQYDPSTCKAKCDSMANCQSFATWIERVPTQKYDATNCPSPSNDPTYQTKCLYYSFPLAASDATNTGQWTNNGQFQVAQASVNFYNKASSNFSPAPVPGYNGPTGGYGVCAPAGTKADMDGPINTASGPVMADSLARTPGPMSSPIDPSFCANTCKTIRDSQATDSHGIKLNCNMFSLFELYSNGKYYYQCQYWTKDLDASRNTNCGGGAVVASWKYTLSDPVPSYVNTKPAQQNY